jgi:uncharacterized protein (TIGR02996 family)
MPDPAPFLAAICASPDDDLPRLVYADWLDEHGDPARAEFIRLQCHTARVGKLDPTWAPAKLREYDLFKANEATWRTPTASAEGRMLMDRWRRGFPRAVMLADVSAGRLTSGECANGVYDWTADLRYDPLPVCPVREVSFNGWRPGCGVALRSDELRTARSLAMAEWYAGVNPESIENFAAELVRLPTDQFPELVELDLDQGELNVAAVEALAAAPVVQTLRKLSLRFPTVFGTNTAVARWRDATSRLFTAIAPQLERLDLHALPPFLVEAFSAVWWSRLKSLRVRHVHENGLPFYDFSRTPHLTELSIFHQSGSGAGRFDPNPMQALDDGWPEASLRVLNLGSVPVNELRPWLAYPERFSLDSLSADVKGGRLRVEELNSYPLTRELKTLKGPHTNAGLTALADPTVLPELHTIWSGETTTRAGLRWRGGVRTIIPKDLPDAWRSRPSRGNWCGGG